MSTESTLLKQARQEVRSGAERQAVFEKYKGQFAKPIRLATFVASTPREPIPSLARMLNIVLLVLLIFAALSKALSAVMLLSGVSVAPMLLGILLSVLIPVVFAVAVAKWEGQVYMLLPLLCLLGILRAWMKSPPLDAAIETIFLLAIGGLAIAVKLMVFPHMGILGVRKDAAGNFVF